MTDELKDILSNDSKDLSEKQLMDYLNNQLSEEDSHEIEKNMAGDEFLNDAVEGLQKIDDNKNLQNYVEQLNKDLQNQITKNKIRKEKRKIKDQAYTYVTIIILLILLIISFVVLKGYLDSKHALKPGTNSNITPTLKN